MMASASGSGDTSLAAVHIMTKTRGRTNLAKMAIFALLMSEEFSELNCDSNHELCVFYRRKSLKHMCEKRFIVRHRWMHVMNNT